MFSSTSVSTNINNHSNSNQLEISKLLLQQQNINVDAEITLAIPILMQTSSADIDDNQNGYELYEVYNPSFLRGGRINISLIYHWNKNTLLRNPTKYTKYTKRLNFGGLTLKGVLTIADIPKNHSLQEDLETTDFAYLDSMNRLNYQLFRIMEDIHNFKIFLIRSKYWGFVVNGSWIGAIGFLVRNDVDLCMTALRWSPERYGFYEPATHTYHVRVLFLFRHPRISLNASNIFLTPFTLTVWISITLIGIIFAFIFRNIISHNNNNNNIDDYDDDDSTWSNSLLLTFGILFQQGTATIPKLSSARIIIIFSLIFSILLFQFYSSFIVASLLTDPPKTIKTIQQLYDSRIECGIDEVSYIRDIFNHATDPIAIKLYKEKIIEFDNVINLDKGIEKIKKGGYAFHTDVSSSYIKMNGAFNDMEICELQEISYAKPFPVGPAVPLMSPFIELIKINIRKMYETGIHAYHSVNWEARKPKCAKSELFVAPVDYEHFSSAVYILMIGMGISAIICLIEIFMEHARKRNYYDRIMKILVLRAERVIAVPPAWEHFEYLD